MIHSLQQGSQSLESIVSKCLVLFLQPQSLVVTPSLSVLIVCSPLSVLLCNYWLCFVFCFVFFRSMWLFLLFSEIRIPSHFSGFESSLRTRQYFLCCVKPSVLWCPALYPCLHSHLTMANSQSCYFCLYLAVWYHAEICAGVGTPAVG